MSRAKGNIAEDQAAQYLVENGFYIIDRNFYSRFGELDIIAKKDAVLHFVEVKSAEDYELAIQNITPTKLSRIIKTADAYMKKHAYEGDFCIDALIVTPQRIEMVENITL
jgi:putative endonuclease